MSEELVIARPYAKAVFDLACNKGSLTQWSDLLNVLSAIVCDEKVMMLIKNPGVSDAKVATVILDVCQKLQPVDEFGKNLLKVLAHNHRLALIPKIADLYEELRRFHDKVIDVEVKSSYPFNEKQKQNLTTVLEKKFDRKVLMQFIDDRSLLGGAIIRVGDFVIDGSVKGKLLRLSNYLNLKEKVCQ